MIAANFGVYDAALLDIVSQLSMVVDGATGTRLWAADLVDTKYVRQQSG